MIVRALCFFVAEAGIEPAVEVDEASVLPLHYPAIKHRNSRRF